MNTSVIAFITLFIVICLLWKYSWSNEKDRIVYLISFVVLIFGFAVAYWNLGGNNFNYTEKSVGLSQNNAEYYELFSVEPKNSNIDILVGKMKNDIQQLVNLRNNFLEATVPFCPTESCAKETILGNGHWHTIQEILGGDSKISSGVSVEKYFEWVANGRKNPLPLHDGRYTKGIPSIYSNYWLLAIPEIIEESTNDLKNQLKLPEEPLFSDYLYFSVISITTTGYGDITPKTPKARMYVALEIISGMMIFGLFLNSLSKD